MEKMEKEPLRLFVDMDGTLAEFKQVDTLEKLYEQGYFLNLEPQQNVVDGIRCLISNHPEVEVFILSSVLSDSEYALSEKNEWLDRYLPEVDGLHRLYPRCGESKLKYLEFLLGSVTECDFLLDDYSNNLHEWDPPAKGIKVMNGINGKNGTWTKDKISIELRGEDFADCVMNIMHNKVMAVDMEANVRIRRGWRR